MGEKEALALALVICNVALMGLVLRSWAAERRASVHRKASEAVSQPLISTPAITPSGPDVAPWLRNVLLDGDMAVEGLHSDLVERLLSDASKEACDSESSMPRLVIEDAACVHHDSENEQEGIFFTPCGECEIVRRRRA